MMSVLFAGELCQVVWRRYGNHRPALLLTTEDDEPVVVASLNVPNLNLAANELVIKDFAENTGVLDALIEAGVVAPPERVVLTPSGFAPLVKILVEVQ